MYKLVVITFVQFVHVQYMYNIAISSLIMYKLYSALTYFPSCTELLTHYLENTKSYTFTVQRCTSVYCSNVLALRCILFTHRNQNALHKNKTQRNQINFAKEPWFRNHRSGPPCCTDCTKTIYCTPYIVQYVQI